MFHVKHRFSAGLEGVWRVLGGVWNRPTACRNAPQPTQARDLYPARFLSCRLPGPPEMMPTA